MLLSPVNKAIAVVIRTCVENALAKMETDGHEIEETFKKELLEALSLDTLAKQKSKPVELKDPNIPKAPNGYLRYRTEYIKQHGATPQKVISEFWKGLNETEKAIYLVSKEEKDLFKQKKEEYLKSAQHLEWAKSH